MNNSNKKVRNSVTHTATAAGSVQGYSKGLQARPSLDTYGRGTGQSKMNSWWLTSWPRPAGYRQYPGWARKTTLFSVQ